MATIVNYDVTSKIGTPAIDAYLLEEQSCQISSRSNLKRRSTGFSKQRRPKKNENNKKMSSNVESVPDPKNTAHKLK